MIHSSFNFKNVRNILASSLLLVSLLVGISSCKTPDEDTEDSINLETLSADLSLVAMWVDSYNSYYQITPIGFKNFGIGYESYEGDNIQIRKISDTAGYIYIKYTKTLCSAHSDFENSLYVYDEDGEEVGKWYAISYKDLTDDSVNISGAYNSKRANSFDSLEEAVKEFTVENGYFGIYSECVKVSAGLEVLTEDSPLFGSWESSYNDKYKFSQDYLTIKNVQNIGREGKNIWVKKVSENSGIIFFKLTVSYNSAESEAKNDLIYNSEGEDVGKWTATFYNKLTEKTVCFFDIQTSFLKFEDAVTNITLDKVNYVEQYEILCTRE